jgi:hypothetical protein
MYRNGYSQVRLDNVIIPMHNVVLRNSIDISFWINLS